MKNKSTYNVWIFRLIYILGLSGAVLNIYSIQPELERRPTRQAASSIYIDEFKSELISVLNSSSFTQLCTAPNSQLARLSRFGSFTSEVRLENSRSSIEMDVLRRCEGRTEKAHAQMETMCFKFKIDPELVDSRSFLADENHIIELNFIPRSFSRKQNISCDSSFGIKHYEGGVVMASIYWQTKDQIQRRNLAFYSIYTPKQSSELRSH